MLRRYLWTSHPAYICCLWKLFIPSVAERLMRMSGIQCFNFYNVIMGAIWSCEEKREQIVPAAPTVFSNGSYGTVWHHYCFATKLCQWHLHLFVLGIYMYIIHYPLYDLLNYLVLIELYFTGWHRRRLSAGQCAPKKQRKSSAGARHQEEWLNAALGAALLWQLLCFSAVLDTPGVEIYLENGWR